MSARFGRVVTAMVTPFTPEGQLDPDEAQRLARHLVDHGSDAVLVYGSTGESPTLSDDEKSTLCRAVVDAVGADVPVIAGTGTYSTEHSVELTRAAEKSGASAALVVTPYYNRPPQDALLDHFRTVADASNLPVILYDIPIRTALKIEVDTLLRAAEHERIVAVKESSGDLSAIARLAAGKPDDFDIYCGQDEWTIAYQAYGAVGAISVAAHVAGERIAAQFAAWERGDTAEATRIQLELVPLVDALFCAPNPIPVKAAMAQLGFRVGSARPPLRPASADEEATVRAALNDLGVA